MTPRNLADEIDRVLLAHSLQAWFPRCIDMVHGGFRQDFSRDWTYRGGQPRSIVFQARMTWAAATAARRRPAAAAALAGAVGHGMDCLETVFWDAPAGGLMFIAGQPAGKHSYGVAFALFAAASAYRYSQSPAHLAFAMRIFDWWDRYGHDKAGRGYFESLDRGGRPAAPAKGRDAIGTPFGQRSSNTLLHAIEALTELCLANPADTVQARLEETIGLLERLVLRDGHRLGRHFDACWKPLDRASSHGHDVQACYLDRRARRALGLGGESPLRRLAERAVRRGYDRRYGGLRSGNRRAWLRRDQAKTWWVQAELLNYLASELTATPPASTRALRRIRQTWRFISECQVDAQHGGWFNTLSRDGTHVLCGDKGGPWKAAYHEVRALLNTADALRALDAAPEQ